MVSIVKLYRRSLCYNDFQLYVVYHGYFNFYGDLVDLGYHRSVHYHCFHGYFICFG
jgi:hypothetical protein